MTTLADTAVAPPLRSAAAIRAAEGVHPTCRPDIAAPTARAMFHLANDHSIADLPASRNGRVALDGLDASVSRLVTAGKQVGLVVDNPTLPPLEDCVGRKTASALVNALLAAPPNPDCSITVAKHLELSRPNRELLEEVQRRHPGRVTSFETVPVLCDMSTQTCAATLGGQFQHGETDHISPDATLLIGRALRAQLRARPAP